MSYLVRAEGTYDVMISPRGDRAVIIAFGYPPGFGGTEGVPVLDATTGQVAYEVTEIRTNPAAAFSAEGETLFVAGKDAEGRQLLLALRAADGQRLRAVPLALNAWGIAPDPARPWLYVTGYTSPGGLGQLLVFDRGSLTLLTTVSAPDSVYGVICCDVAAHIIPSPAEQRVYIVSALEFREPAARAFLTRFRTPP
jgi:hypothetical protein